MRDKALEHYGKAGVKCTNIAAVRVPLAVPLGCVCVGVRGEWGRDAAKDPCLSHVPGRILLKYVPTWAKVV